MSFQRRFEGSNDEQLFQVGCQESDSYCGKCKRSQCIYTGFEEAFKPEATIFWYCWRCNNYGENIIVRNGKHFCGLCGRFASKDVICKC